MKGPVLKVLQRVVTNPRRRTHAWEWKVWWRTHEPTRYRHRARLEGPPIIYQDGSHGWP